MQSSPSYIVEGEITLLSFWGLHFYYYYYHYQEPFSLGSKFFIFVDPQGAVSHTVGRNGRRRKRDRCQISILPHQLLKDEVSFVDILTEVYEV